MKQTECKVLGTANKPGQMRKIKHFSRILKFPVFTFTGDDILSKRDCEQQVNRCMKTMEWRNDV